MERSYYTGIGSRETPEEALRLFERISYLLAKRGWVVRSGGAPGADEAFICDALLWSKDSVEIYLPWPGFNNWDWDEDIKMLEEPQPEAFDIAAKYHPHWQYLKQGAKKLHARNVHQILGEDVLAPKLTEFVLCWTKNGKVVGGTAQAIRIANDYGVPVFNLGNPSTYMLFSDIIFYK